MLLRGNLHSTVSLVVSHRSSWGKLHAYLNAMVWVYLLYISIRVRWGLKFEWGKSSFEPMSMF